MNRKKLISVGLTAAMLTGLLAGCGDSSQNSSQNGSGAAVVGLIPGEYGTESGM